MDFSHQYFLLRFIKSNSMNIQSYMKLSTRSKKPKLFSCFWLYRFFQSSLFYSDLAVNIFLLVASGWMQLINTKCWLWSTDWSSQTVRRDKLFSLLNVLYWYWLENTEYRIYLHLVVVKGWIVCYRTPYCKRCHKRRCSNRSLMCGRLATTLIATILSLVPFSIFFSVSTFSHRKAVWIKTSTTCCKIEYRL